MLSRHTSTDISMPAIKYRSVSETLSILPLFRNAQFMTLLKNLSIAGGLLIIASNEPKICTLDYYLKSKQS